MNIPKHIPVFIEGQDDLVDILATAICSIAYNTTSQVDIYILDCGICHFNKKQLNSLKAKFSNLSLEFLPIDLKRFEGMKGWPPPKYQFVDCYARLLIPELKPELDKAIYLDSDIILMDDIKLLWEQDLCGYEIGLVADLGYQKVYYDNCTQKLGISPDHIYANAGMFLIDCKQWREHKTTEKLLQIGRENKNNLLVLNEDILSIYYNNNRYKLLDNRFNMTDLNCRIYNQKASGITDEYLSEEWKNVVVYHFCHGKPFKQIDNSHQNKTIKHFDSFWFFAQMTPYYVGMQLRFEEMKDNQKQNRTLKVKYKLFNILPIMTIKIKCNTKYYKLFGFLSIMKSKELK